MNIAASVSSPDAALFSDGTLELCQTVTPDMEYLNSDNSLYVLDNNGEQGLDGAYLYGWNQSTPFYQTADSPGFGLVDQTTIQAYMNNDFEDYLMYKPPYSSQEVPLAHFIWNAMGNANVPSTGVWADYAKENGGSDSAGTVTDSDKDATFLGSNEFPMWTQIDTARFVLQSPFPASKSARLRPVRRQSNRRKS